MVPCELLAFCLLLISVSTFCAMNMKQLCVSGYCFKLVTLFQCTAMRLKMQHHQGRVFSVVVFPLVEIHFLGEIIIRALSVEIDFWCLFSRDWTRGNPQSAYQHR